MALGQKARIVAAGLCRCVAVASLLGCGERAMGEDFRIENAVYSAGRDKADCQSVTVFHNGLVYDFLDEPAEVIVLDQPEGRFVLLDPARRVRTELDTAEVLAFTQRLQQRAAAQNDPLLKFLAAPHFDEDFEPSRRDLTLSSPWMTYRVTVSDAPVAAMARQVRDFSDWYARLNTMLNPGSKPPLARLEVNAALARRDAIAKEVQLTTRAATDTGTTSTTVRSVHHLVRPLPEADRDRVAKAQQSMKTFKSVGFTEYRQGN